MKLSELIDELLTITISNPMIREIIAESIALYSQSNPIVILSKDAEGNEYRPLSGAETAFYLPDTSWRGQTLDADELADHDPLSVQPCIVLWPKGLTK